MAFNDGWTRKRLENRKNKFESTENFLRRGGKIVKCPAKGVPDTLPWNKLTGYQKPVILV